MSKTSHKARLDALHGWLEQTRKNAKYGKPKRIVLDDEVDVQYKLKNRKR
jgi:hypothetical protein